MQELGLSSGDKRSRNILLVSMSLAGLTWALSDCTVRAFFFERNASTLRFILLLELVEWAQQTQLSQRTGDCNHSHA